MREGGGEVPGLHAGPLPSIAGNAVEGMVLGHSQREY